MSEPTKEQAKAAAVFLRREQDISIRSLASRLSCSPSKAADYNDPDIRRFVCKVAAQYGWKA
ncbi:hypothetical protein [Ensifer canadensis]|uniref:hypothetical protein n=1 Tax=Ensifer canadensis TaxID=555315 RepID=UPI0035E3BECC